MTPRGYNQQIHTVRTCVGQTTLLMRWRAGVGKSGRVYKQISVTAKSTVTYEPYLDPDSKKQSTKTINSIIGERWVLTGYLTVLWDYSLAGWGKVVVIDTVIMFEKGSPCFFKAI